MADLKYNASSTYGTTLTVGTVTVYIKDYPDLGGKPEMLETTTLSDSMQTYINGIQTFDDVSFTANYEKSVFTSLRALQTAGDAVDCEVDFGSAGEDGKFSFQGRVSVYATGGGVNEVRDMTITLAPSSEITFA